jgi:hypothetical protein
LTSAAQPYNGQRQTRSHLGLQHLLPGFIVGPSLKYR